jgi:hypothetical protein
MPAWPKSIISLGATLLTARTAMRLRRRDRGNAAQRRAFGNILGHLAQTAFWREAGVQRGMSYEAFRTRVALRRYETFAPEIDRMQQGEADVLWPGACSFFVSSSGTSVGTAKTLPVTAAMFGHFRAGCRDALLYYMARTGRTGVLHGRHLFLTGSTALRPLGIEPTPTRFVGDWPAIAALNLPTWADARVFEPGAEIASMTDWQAKIEATANRILERDIALIAGMPLWVLAFTELIQAKLREAGQRGNDLKSLWPNLECFVHGGMPLGPYEAELRDVLGPSVNFHEVYAAAEGFLGAQDGAASAGLRVMSDLGLFFEFLPFADFDESRLDQIGSKAVPLSEVATGVNYVVVLTSPAGLARYVIGDIVRFTSTEPPRFTYVGRTALQLNAFGEHVLEKEITDALLAICQRHRWTIVNFHVAPLFAASLTGQQRGRHEWWIELRPGTVETPTGPPMAVELDLELQRLNPEYAARRRNGRIDAPVVRLVMPGVFRHWLRFHGKWGGQNKIARGRSDRVIADELAHMTRFAED